MTLFKSRISKVILDQTTGGFTIITPIYIFIDGLFIESLLHLMFFFFPTFFELQLMYLHLY